MISKKKTVVSLFLLLFVSMFCVIYGDSGGRGPNNGVPNMEKEWQDINKAFETFEKSKNLDDLEKAGKLIKDVRNEHKDRTAEWNANRRMKLNLWLTALNKIDANIDDHFDFDDVPQLNIAPPEGVMLDAGIDPKAIKDTKLRSQYEEAIKQNDEKANRYRFQKKIRKIEKEWSKEIMIYINDNYIDTPEDFAEVKNAIDTYTFSEKRKTKIKSELKMKKNRVIDGPTK